MSGNSNPMDLKNIKFIIFSLDILLFILVIISLATKGVLLPSINLKSSDLIDGDQNYSPSQMVLTTFVFDIVYAFACIFLVVVIYRKQEYSGLYKMGLVAFFIGRFVVGVLFLSANNGYFKNADNGAWIYEIIFICLGSIVEVTLLCYLSKLCDIILPPSNENLETNQNPNANSNF